MRSWRYSKWEGEADDPLELEAIMDMLADLLIEGRQGIWFEDESGITFKDIQDILDALEVLEQQGLLPERYQGEEGMKKLMERLEEEGYIRRERQKPDLTQKGLERVSEKTLRDLLQSIGKSGVGHHETRQPGTGIETDYSTKPYEYGDPLNLDVSGTLLNAAIREGPKVPLPLEADDLEIYQSEHMAPCATVLCLDCSHSMILYGEDRWTPARRVAMALAHLIRTQYPGDSLNVVLFHDDAEEIRPDDLLYTDIGPHYTNTREGLILAQRILSRKRTLNRQIIMITDGKPSVITEGDRIYRDPSWGLNPLIVTKTLDEARRCRNSGVIINTFMLARDMTLVDFVRKVTSITRGRAYFASPRTLGQYLLLDFMTRKGRRIK
jgi:Ca-activated chloride channel family protein